MRSLAVAFLIAALAGCATHSYTEINAGARTAGTLPAVGTSVTSGFINVSIASASAAAAIAGIAVVGFVFHGLPDDAWEANQGYGLFRPAPELAEDRVIHEQDCSKPIENPGANLRCK